MAPHWSVSNGLPLQGIESQPDSLKSTDVLIWTHKDFSGTVQPYIASEIL